MTFVKARSGTCSGSGSLARCAICCFSSVHKPTESSTPQPDTSADALKTNGRSRRRRRLLIFAAVLSLLVAGVRLALPSTLRWYVNRTIDQSPLYDGEVGDIDVSLWRGAYVIKDIRLNKTTGNVPVPLFAAKRVDLAIQWDALMAGEVVGRIVLDQPELNFVDGKRQGEDQTGAGGPWLKMINDLFPFRINRLLVYGGSIHFRAFATTPPLDASLSEVEASIENLTNIHEEITPLIATVKATALAMGHAKVEYEMKVDPFSYKPTFQMALRLLGLDVTKTNDIARAYGAFDFEDGWFDLVVELDAKEGRLDGYVKPLFRNLKVLGLSKDLQEDNVLQFFWETLIGTAAQILKNQPRDQVATVIPLRGDVTSPTSDILAMIGNVLRNAFIRAYLPRLQGVTEDLDGLEFGPASITDPVAVGSGL
jgi:hypothetical protein